MSKAALCATSTVSRAKAWNTGRTSRIVGCPASASGRMPWIAADARSSGRRGSTSCSKHSWRNSRPLTMRSAPIWMISSPSDGFRPVVSVSNTVRLSSDERALVERARLRRGLEQVEVVELGATVLAADAPPRAALGGRAGQQEAEEGLVPDALALEPELAAVALDDVAHRQRRRVLAAAHRLHLPVHHGLGAHRLAGPHQVEPGPRSGRLQAQSHGGRHTRRPAGPRGRPAPAAASSCRPCSQSVGSTSSAPPAPPRASMRRTAAATRSAPSMSSIGQRVFSPVSTSPAQACRRAGSSPRPRRARPPGNARASGLRGRAARASRPPPAVLAERRAAAFGQAEQQRSRTASCSKSRVMSSSISTKPPRAAAPSHRGSPGRAPAPSARAAAGRPGVPVTNCADGLAAPSRMRLRMLSSACATSVAGRRRRRSSGRGRSARRRRPSRASRPAPELQPGAAVVEQDRPSRLQTTTLWVSSAISADSRLRSSSMPRLACRDLRGDVRLQRAALAHQRVERRPVPASGAALGFDLALRLGRERASPGPARAAARRDDQSPVGAAQRRPEPGEPQPSAPASAPRDSSTAARHARPARGGGDETATPAAISASRSAGPTWRSVRAGRSSCDSRAAKKTTLQPHGASSDRWSLIERPWRRRPWPHCAGRSPQAGPLALRFMPPPAFRAPSRTPGRERLGHVGIGAQAECLWRRRCRGPWRSASRSACPSPASSARTSWHTSKPVFLGIITSSSTSAGRSRRIASSASAPSRATLTA